jgi:RecA/RadA recombinase
VAKKKKKTAKSVPRVAVAAAEPLSVENTVTTENESSGPEDEVVETEDTVDEVSAGPASDDGVTVSFQASDDDPGPDAEDRPRVDEEKPIKVKKAPVVKTSKKGGIDPFDAFVFAAKERWPGSIEKASELSVDGTPVMSTGNFVLDRMTYGGLRRGRLYRFWGKPKSAKTGSALNCAEAFTSNHCADCFDHRSKCKCKGAFRYAKCLYIDVEGRVSDNRPWAEAHGIEPTRLAFVSPKGGEQVVDIADAALRSDAGIGLIIVDSIAQMSSASEITKTAEKGQTIGRNAMLINSALRKWVCSLVSKDIDCKQKPTIILVNQIRNKTGAYGNPDTMPGGLGQDYASACDIKFTRRLRHYLMPDGKGGFADKVVKFGGTGFKPGEDDTADFIEIEAKVTESGICAAGRYGTFNYWQRAGHGHRVGDTDNALWLWNYAKKYELLKKDGANYQLASLEAKTQREMETLFGASVEAQEQVWNELMGILSK